MTKKSVVSFQFKNIVLKINHTDSTMSDRKNLSLVEIEPLAEAVLMKKVRRNVKKVKRKIRCVGKMHGKSYREIKLYRKW